MEKRDYVRMGFDCEDVKERVVRKIPYEQYPEKLKKLIEAAEEVMEDLANDGELSRWLWMHTRSMEHYFMLDEAVVYIVNQKGAFVEWIKK